MLKRLYWNSDDDRDNDEYGYDDVVIIVVMAATGESTNITGGRFLKLLRWSTKQFRYS
jgi:hypothetical protein